MLAGSAVRDRRTESGVTHSSASASACSPLPETAARACFRPPSPPARPPLSALSLARALASLLRLSLASASNDNGALPSPPHARA